MLQPLGTKGPGESAQRVAISVVELRALTAIEHAIEGGLIRTVPAPAEQLEQ